MNKVIIELYSHPVWGERIKTVSTIREYYEAAADHVSMELRNLSATAAKMPEYNMDPDEIAEKLSRLSYLAAEDIDAHVAALDECMIHDVRFMCDSTIALRDISAMDLSKPQETGMMLQFTHGMLDMFYPEPPKEN